MELPVEAEKILNGDAPARGERTRRLLEVAMILGAHGWTNHEILEVVEKYGSKWRTLPSMNRNRFARYKQLLNIVAAVRRRYPSPKEASE